MSENTQGGIQPRYFVSKADGPTDPDAFYFVLRLDDYGDDERHVQACRAAMLTYANHISDHLPELAEDIRRRYAEGDWGAI